MLYRTSTILRTVFACGLALLPCSMAHAAEGAKAAEPAITKITVSPATFTLRGSRAELRPVVTGHHADGTLSDQTANTTWTVSNAKVAKLAEGFVLPIADGAFELTAQVGKLNAKMTGKVEKAADPAPVSFHNETLAALSKTSCNMGACHGSPSGKGGFRLSLRAYDPELDILTLKGEFYGRRANPMAPDESLLLRKPLMELAHGGGRRIKKTDTAYKVLRNWIGEGMRTDVEKSITCDKITVFPEQRILEAPANRQQIQVFGHFSDGSVRDVTTLSFFSSSNEAVASVNDDGLVNKVARGETAVLARYLDKMATSYITFLEDVPGFVWQNPPENNFVDKHVYAKLKQLQIAPSEQCTDDEFVRRAYLDSIGRLPTLDETLAFLNDPAANRRDKLVDKLVDSDDFASYWTLMLGDILRVNSKKLKSVGVQKFRYWLFDAVRGDMPMDQFVRDLLTARGSVNENPAGNYWRASRDPQDATETTVQLFLGIRIQCAKCHNHPFERWTQDNYYGIGAAFARIGRKPGNDADDEVVFVANSGEVTQPRTGKQMKVHLLLKGDVDVPATSDRRDVFAKWLTEPSNPFFAKSVVNRIWGQLFGRGIVEPVDDFRDSNPASNAGLLGSLADEFVKNGYSRKWAVKTIMKSRTYQHSSRKNEFNAQDELYFSHANARLLSAEQLLDSICQVTGVNESFAGAPPGTRAVELPEPPTDNYFLKIFGQPQREMACQCERSNESNLSQALQMINGPVVHNKLKDANGRIGKQIAAKKSDEEIITEMYLTAVCRKPTPTELESARQHVTQVKDRQIALEDIGWVILNSKEFLFQH